MPNMDRIYDNLHFALRLEAIEISRDYRCFNLTVKKKHKWFSKDTYYLTCDASKKNIIPLIQMNIPKCQKILGIDKYVLADLLHDNEYNNGYFKTADAAQRVADYIKSILVLKTLKI